jgi:UDP-N-acetyl-D-mannosaminuronic acid dehydrogenase
VCLELDPNELKVLMRQAHPVMVDGRNIVSADDFIENGFIYKGIGGGDVNEHPLRYG